MSSKSKQIAQRVALELNHGEVVNLGIGIPTLVADFIPEGLEVFFQTENGMLGVGPHPEVDQVDQNLVNAGKQPISEMVGASYFHSADSFGMIRGEHIDVAVLGVLQVDETGRIANWAIPGKTIMGVGGAMDLLVGAKKIIVATTHTTKEGKPKILKECTFPITATRQVDMIVTDLCVFKREGDQLILVELMDGVSLSEVQQATTAHFVIAPSLQEELQ